MTTYFTIFMCFLKLMYCNAYRTNNISLDGCLAYYKNWIVMICTILTGKCRHVLGIYFCQDSIFMKWWCLFGWWLHKKFPYARYCLARLHFSWKGRLTDDGVVFDPSTAILNVSYEYHSVRRWFVSVELPSSGVQWGWQKGNTGLWKWSLVSPWKRLGHLCHPALHEM